MSHEMIKCFCDQESCSDEEGYCETKGACFAHANIEQQSKARGMSHTH